MDQEPARRPSDVGGLTVGHPWPPEPAPTAWLRPRPRRKAPTPADPRPRGPESRDPEAAGHPVSQTGEKRGPACMGEQAMDRYAPPVSLVQRAQPGSDTQCLGTGERQGPLHLGGLVAVNGLGIEAEQDGDAEARPPRDLGRGDAGFKPGGDAACGRGSAARGRAESAPAGSPRGPASSVRVAEYEPVDPRVERTPEHLRRGHRGCPWPASA